MALFASSSAYENFMGRYSRQLARQFAEFAGVASGDSVADVGAGTGALSAALLERGASVAAAEPSPWLVTALREQLPEVDAQEAPAEKLPWREHAFDVALGQLVVSFMRDAPAGVAEMRRVVRPGGTVALCMWDRDGMEMLTALRRTQEALASSEPTPAGVRYRTREEIESLFEDGFTAIATESLEVESTYGDFDELVERPRRLGPRWGVGDLARRARARGGARRAAPTGRCAGGVVHAPRSGVGDASPSSDIGRC